MSDTILPVNIWGISGPPTQRTLAGVARYGDWLFDKVGLTLYINVGTLERPLWLAAFSVPAPSAPGVLS